MYFYFENKDGINDPDSKCWFGAFWALKKEGFHTSVGFICRCRRHIFFCHCLYCTDHPHVTHLCGILFRSLNTIPIIFPLKVFPELRREYSHWGVDLLPWYTDHFLKSYKKSKIKWQISTQIWNSRECKNKSLWIIECCISFPPIFSILCYKMKIFKI